MNVSSSTCIPKANGMWLGSEELAWRCPWWSGAQSLCSADEPWLVGPKAESLEGGRWSLPSACASQNSLSAAAEILEKRTGVGWECPGGQPSICPSTTHSFIHLSTHPSICPSTTHPFIHLSFCLSDHSSVHLLTNPSIRYLSTLLAVGWGHSSGNRLPFCPCKAHSLE